ncbi:MAG: PKD domain-containing protein, partial [Bacteroidota bacterium]
MKQPIGPLFPDNYNFVAGQGTVVALPNSGDIAISDVSITTETVTFTITVSGSATPDVIEIRDLRVTATNNTDPGSVRIRQSTGTNPLNIGIGADANLAIIEPSPDLEPTIDEITNDPLCGSSDVAFEVSLGNGDFGDVTSARAIRNRGNALLATYSATDLPNSGTTATLTAAASGDWQAGDQLIFEVISDGCSSTSSPVEIDLFVGGSAQITFTTAAAPQTSSLTASIVSLDISNTEPSGTFSVQDGDRTLVAGRDYEITPTGNAFAISGDNYTFTVADASSFNIYTLRWGSNLNSLTNRVECGSLLLIVRLFDGSPRQLVGITNSTVCRQLTGRIDVGWVGEGVTGDLISIRSVNARPIGSAVPTFTNIITGSIDGDYDGGIESGAEIVMNNIDEDTDNFTVQIRYRVIDDEGDITTTTRNVYETIQVEDELSITLTLAGGTSPKARYCANDDPIDLVGAVDAGAVGVRAFTVTDLDPGGSPINFDDGAPRRINFSNLASEVGGNDQGITVVPNQNGYRIDFNFTSAANCESNDSFEFTVAPLPPVIDIDPSTPDIETIEVNYCVGVPLDPIDLNLPVRLPDEDPDTRVVWLTDTEIPIDTVAFDAPYLPEDITNLRIGEYDYLVQLLSADTCTGPTTRVEVAVGEVPQANFTFREACDDQEVQVWDASVVTNDSDPNSVITRWRWDFGDGTIVDAPTGETQTHVYTDEPNVYTVTLITETAIGCSDTMAKQVVVYESPTLNNETAYVATFEEGQDGWVASRETENGNGIGREANWERTMIPDTTVATGMIGVWRNDYNNDENSWIESPCIDLTDVDNPFVNMRIRYDLEPGADGVVMQVGYDRDSTIEGETRRITVWERLGEQGAGLNWYNTLGVTGFPVTDDFPGYDEPRIGWSDSTGWVEASLDLASVKAAANGDPVRFRLFLGSNNDNVGGEKGTGFILDQFEVLNRERVVLIEHFSNLNEDNQQDFTLEEFLDSTRAEVNIVDLRYHTILPFQDEVTLVGVSQAPNSGRSLHYKVASPPQVVIDGARVNLAGEDFRIWSDTTATYYGQRILTKSLFDIIITPPTGATAGNPATLEATVTRNSVGDSTLTPNAILVHMAIVEKEAEHGGRTLYNLVRNMLPTAAGTRFN